MSALGRSNQSILLLGVSMLNEFAFQASTSGTSFSAPSVLGSSAFNIFISGLVQVKLLCFGIYSSSLMF